MTMHQDGKKTVVTVDAETGAYVGQTKSSRITSLNQIKEADGRRTNIIWDNTIDMVVNLFIDNLKRAEDKIFSSLLFIL